MRLLRSFPTLAFAVVLLSIIAYGVASGSLGFLLVTGALVLMSWYVTEGPRGRFLPRWVSNVLLIAVVLNFVADYLAHHELDEVMSVLSRFTIWLMLIKLYERKGPRDYSQLLALSLLLMLACCFLTTHVLFGALLLAYAVLGLYVLVLFQLYAAHEEAKDASRMAAPRDYRLAPSVQAIIGRRVGLDFRGLVLLIALSALLVSSLVFVVFPRQLGQDTVAFIPMPTPSRRVGFSDRFDPTNSGRINESRRRVMRLAVAGPDGAATRLPEPVLLRGAVFDLYEGKGAWGRTHGPESETVVIETVPEVFLPLGSDAAVNAGPTYTLDVRYFVPHDRIFSIAVPVALSTDGVERLTFDPAVLTIEQAGAGWLTRYVVRARMRPQERTLRSLARGREPRRPGGYAEVSSDLLPQLATLRDTARGLLESAGLVPSPPSPPASARWAWSEAAARVLARHLQEDGYAYTLDLSDVVHETGVDPVADFVLRQKRGHCEYFASAHALMCQLVGIDARIVTGYVAYDYDEESACYHILEGNAHAWTEVRGGRYRWTPYDPTPPAILAQQHTVERTFGDSIRWFFDGMESRWDQTVIAFDGTTQRRLGQTIDVAWSRRLERLWSDTRERLAEVNRAFHLGPAGYIWMGIVALALVVAVIALVKIVRRSRRLHRMLALQHLRGAEYQRMLRQLGFYLDMLAILHRAGLGKPSWRPPLRHAEALVVERPEVAPLVRDLTALFYRGRYGHEALPRHDAARAREMVRELAAVLRVRP